MTVVTPTNAQSALETRGGLGEGQGAWVCSLPPLRGGKPHASQRRSVEVTVQVEKEASSSPFRIPVLAADLCALRAIHQHMGFGEEIPAGKTVSFHTLTVCLVPWPDNGKAFLILLLCPSLPIHGQRCQLNLQHRFRICPLVSISSSPAPTSIPYLPSF